MTNDDYSDLNIKARLIVRDGYRCSYCRQPFSANMEGWTFIHVDHQGVRTVNRRAPWMFVWAMATACAHGQAEPDVERNIQQSAMTPSSEYPEWMLAGSVAFADERGRGFRGVGMATGLKSEKLMRSVVDSHAKAELAKVFETYTSAFLLKAYLATLQPGDPTEQKMGEAVATFSAKTLDQVQIVDHFLFTDGTIYALAELRLPVFVKALDTMAELDGRIRDFARSNAEHQHAAMLAKQAHKREVEPAALDPE